MTQNHKLWLLFSRKLTGEASELELAELQELLDEFPALQETLLFLDRFWTTSLPCASENMEAIFNRHMARMERMGISC